MARVVVIGGGIVGISCALTLQSQGHEVTVVEPGPVGEGASWASCGCIAVGEIVPLSQPGMLMLTDCIDTCSGNSSCRSINYETGLCVLFSSSAEIHPGKQC